MTQRSNVTKALLLPPTAMAAAALLATLPWSLAQPLDGTGAQQAGWSFGIIALVAYPIAVIAQLLLMAWLARRAKRRGVELPRTLRRSLLLVMPVLLVAFVLAMAVALWLRYG